MLAPSVSVMTHWRGNLCRSGRCRLVCLVPGDHFAGAQTNKTADGCETQAQPRRFSQGRLNAVDMRFPGRWPAVLGDDPAPAGECASD